MNLVLVETTKYQQLLNDQVKGQWWTLEDVYNELKLLEKHLQKNPTQS
ncbi:DUF771 domain-containing protein [Shouchella miscanthi]